MARKKIKADYSSKIADLNARLSDGLAAVSTAQENLASAKADRVKVLHAADARVERAEAGLAAAQGELVASVGPALAAQMLDVSVAKAKTLKAAKTSDQPNAAVTALVTRALPKDDRLSEDAG